MKKIIIGLLIILVLAAGGIYFYNNIQSKEDRTQIIKNGYLSFASNSTIKILQVWEMPSELKEISANVLIDENHMACIQDNDGIIFIYNLKSKSIDNKITFGGKGDYEGLAAVGKLYYVLRSDGFLYQVESNGNNKPTVSTIDLPLNTVNDTEPMFFDSPHNRLLIGNKEKNYSGGDGKDIYSFDLSTKKMNTQAVIMISVNENEGSDNGGKKNKGKKNRMDIKPSEIAIHPQTGEIYILNGPKSELLIADASGKIKSSYQLDTQTFPQPEGMCFASNGDLYISSEAGKKGKGLIAKVQL